MVDLVAAFSSKNDNKFNDDLILGLRNNDKMVDYIDDACKAIVQLIPEYVKYKGFHYLDNRKRMLERDEEHDENDYKNELRININDTYAKEAVFEFTCTFQGQVISQKFSLWIPLLIDNSHFFIRGNKYSCPIQIIDAITFTKKDVLVLKTITRAIKFEREKIILTDIFGNKYNTNKLMIYITRKSIPVLVYYFARFGFFNTLKYFGTDEYIKLYSGDLSSGVPEDKYIFKFGSVYLGVDKKAFESNPVLRMFVATIIASGKRTIDMDYIRNPCRWTMLLGETISIPKSLEKGVALLKTFTASMDYRTKTIINQLVPGSPRNDIFSVVRWIFVNYVQLCSKDDGLQNKRLRLNEYLINPFIKMLTEKVYRFVNTPEKIKTLKGLTDIFKIKSSLILNAIIGKISPQITGLNIAKFSSETNDDALVNTLLTTTKSGPGSPTEKSKRLGISHRIAPIDYIGNIDIVTGSAANPGLTNLLTPINKDFENERKIFIIDPKLIKK